VEYSNAAASATYDLPIAAGTTLVIYEPAARPANVTIERTVELAGGASLDLATVPRGTLGLHGADIDAVRR